MDANLIIIAIHGIAGVLIGVTMIIFGIMDLKKARQDKQNG